MQIHGLQACFATCLVIFPVLAAVSSAQQDVRLPSALPEMRDPKPILPPTRDWKAPERPGRSGASVSKPLPPNAPTSAFARIDHDRVYVSDQGGVVWARGKDWKASFDGSSATFIPFLGSQAPRDYPLVVSLADARIGAVELPTAEQGVVSNTSERVTIDRGGLVEVYDLSPKSIEQTFVIESLPAHGDLVLHVALSSELVAREDSDGFVFSNELGAVHCSRASTTDADGDSLATRTRLFDGQLEITIDSDAVAHARLPLRIDPVFSVFAVDTSNSNDYSPDIAYDAVHARYCIVYEEQYSASDHDVFSVVRDSAGNALGVDLYLDLTTDSWMDPKVASNPSNSNFMAVASVRYAAGGDPHISGVTRSATIQSVGSQFVINGPESGPKVHPDIGGDASSSGPSYYCVVWERDYIVGDSDIHARLVNPNGTLFGPSTILLENSVNTIELYPCISKCNGGPPAATQAWNVAWLRFSGASATPLIAQIRWDGAITTPTHSAASGIASIPSVFEIAVSSPLDAPVGSPRPYLVVTAGNYLATNKAHLVGTMMSGGTITASADLTVTDGINVTENHISPSVDTDGALFAVGFAESFNGSLSDDDTYVSTFYFTADPGLGYVAHCAESHSALDTTSPSSSGPRVCALRSGGAPYPSHRFGLTWDYAATSLDEDVYAGIYDGPASAPIQYFCSSNTIGALCPCGNAGVGVRGCANSVNANGAFLDVLGTALTQRDSAVLSGSGMPANATCLFFQGTGIAASPAAFGDGVRCANGAVIRLGTKVCVNGAASYPGASDPTVSQKGLVPGVGGFRTYQAWYRNPDPNFCTPSTFNLSNGCAIDWLP